MIVYSNQKGKEALSGFDFKNIKGRAGRFLHHFVGRVIMFHPLDEAEREIVSFHYLDDNDLGSDELLSVDENDLRPDARQKRTRVLEMLNLERVPLDVVRQNKYIAIEKQLALVNRLRRSSALRSALAFEGNLPTRAVFDAILDVCREDLFNRGDYQDRNFAPGELNRLTKYYVYRRPSLKEFIATQKGTAIDTQIRKTFYLTSHYFEFAFPKYLSALQNLFNFVASEKGESARVHLRYITTMLQYGFTEPHEIALKDAGLPDEVISKVSERLKEYRSLEEIRYAVNFEPAILRTLTDYERSLFKKVL